jgi:hypothetical protein
MRLDSAGLIALAVCTSSVVARAQEPGNAQRFSVPGHGSLLLNAPKEWRVAVHSIQTPPSVALRFGPVSGDAFSVQVTSVWIDPSRQAKVTPDSIKETVRKSAADALAGAVEKDASLVEIRGKEAVGYHFSVTDRGPSSEPGEYKYMTQGGVLIGPLMTVFTVLHRDPGAAEKQQALQVFANATWSTTQPAEASASDSGSIRVEVVNQGYQLSVAASRLVMTIPRGGLKKAPGEAGGSPTYFHLVDEGQGISVSGWFAPAQGFPGTRKFWEAETKQWSSHGIPDPREVSFTKVGDWDAILYDMPIPSATNSHVRAHWLQAGTWIDLHMSLTSMRPSAESRATLLTLLKAVRVKQKD